MNILITGAGGFIGTALRNYLKSHQPSVKVLGVVKSRSRSTVIHGDLNDENKVREILIRTQPQIIFHLAGGRPADEGMLWQANMIPTQVLLNAVAQLKKTKRINSVIVIPGSAAEYGQMRSKRPISETTTPEPLARYGFVKYMQTTLGLLYARQGLDVRVARIFNVCGYGTPSFLALGHFAQKIVQMERKKQLLSFKVGNLKGRRDFLDIEDVCAALWAVARRGKRGEVYNVCSGKASHLRLLLRRLIGYSTVKNIKVSEERKAHSASFDSVGSSAKIKRATGWRPRVHLDESLKNTLRYYREQAR